MTPENPYVVTMAALYGAGGTVIGPRVAEALAVPFLDRAIPEAVSRETGVSEQAVAAVDEEPRSRTEQLFSRLGRAAAPGGDTFGSADGLDLEERRLRGYFEEFLARASLEGGVALGRGGMVVLRDAPSALHVHLGGPREARIQQAMAIDGIERQAAERAQGDEDRARIDYVRRAYGVDGEDPSLYHLMLDSTALEAGTCVDLIVAAAKARAGAARPASAS